MKEVVIIQEHLPHYRQKFYELLHDRLKARGIHLSLVYSPNTAANLLAGRLDWAVPVPVRQVGGFSYQSVMSITREADLVIVQQESKYLANYLLQGRRILSNQKVAYWGHGRNFQSSNASLLGETLKKHFSRACDWWFAYNDLSVEVVKALGYPEERITSVQNSIDTRSIATVRERTTDAELAKIREELGITTENVAVFTGGLYSDKRIPFLLEACKLIRREIRDFQLIVIGKGPDSHLVREATQSHRWIHFAGAKNDSEKVPYWMLSKVLLMPGLVGLVVLDSFALGVPMVTTNFPDHSPEISYLENGINGLIVSPWPDCSEYARQTVELLRDDEKLLELKKNALDAADNFSIGKMAAHFESGILEALKAPRLRRSMLRKLKRPLTRKSDFRLGITVRSLSPYLRDFYDALSFETGRGALRVFIGQSGSDWVNPWDSNLMIPRSVDHVFVNAKSIQGVFRTILPSKQLLIALERFRPNVLLLNEYSPLSLFGMIWAVLARIPWIVATDIGPDYRRPYPALTLLQQFVHRFANHFATGLLALTPSAVKRAQKLQKKFLLCPHAINTSVFVPPATKSKSGECVRLISTGNFIFRKGYDLLMRALAAMGPECKVPWQLHCYGSGSPNTLRSLCEELGIADRVFFTGFLAEKDLIAAYQESDVFVLATRSDTYGVVVHEAASCGLPLLVSKYAGASEVLVEEGANGFVIDPEDTKEFANRLSRMIENGELRKSQGLRSRAIAENWDVGKNAASAMLWIRSIASEYFKTQTENENKSIG